MTQDLKTKLIQETKTKFREKFPVRPSLTDTDKLVIYSREQFGLMEADIEDFQQFLATEIGNAVEKTVEEIKSFIISKTTGPTSDGSYKYWNEEAFEQYFEDRGYKYGPQRFIDDLLSTLTQTKGEDK